MRTTLQNVPGSTIFLVFLLVIGQVALAGDRPTGQGDANAGTTICFPVGDGERILRELEQAESCKEAVTAGEDALNATETRAKALENRIDEQDRELTDARKLVEDTRKAGEEAAKVAAGPWYVRAMATVKWVALGVLIGFVGGMAK